MIRNALFALLLLPSKAVGHGQDAVADVAASRGDASAAKEQRRTLQRNKTPRPTSRPTGPSPPGPPPPPPPTATPGGPKIAMAWISDQFANFDVVWDMTTNCDANDAIGSNQFKCCHDWLLDSLYGINVVSLAFLKPTEIMNPSSCATGTCTDRGVRSGMPGAVRYFKDGGMDLVFVTIGGATYTRYWEEVLINNATAGEFATKVASIALDLGVGIEIDYEESASPNLAGLEHFVRTYRSIIPYDDVARTPQSFLTIDFGQGAQFMGPVANWVARNAFDPNPKKRLLNWANAMVAGSRESRVSDLIDRWGQHVNGYSTLQTFPIPPAYLVGSLWSSGRDVQATCVDSNSPTLLNTALVDYIRNVEPCAVMSGKCKAALPVAASAYTKGLLGYAFWMCGNIGPSQVNTCPIGITIDIYGTSYPGNGDCRSGFGAARNVYGITRPVDWNSRKF